MLGLARQGQAAALALARRGVRVVGVDASTQVDAGRLAAAGVEVRLGREEEAELDGVEVLVKSGGVPNDAPLVTAARTRGIRVWSDVEVASRVLPNPILGVTGTNGKTTTSAERGSQSASRCVTRPNAPPRGPPRPLG